MERLDLRFSAGLGKPGLKNDSQSFGCRDEESPAFPATMTPKTLRPKIPLCYDAATLRYNPTQEGIIRRPPLSSCEGYMV
jgi:hypothetical protein